MGGSPHSGATQCSRLLQLVLAQTNLQPSGSTGKDPDSRGSVLVLIVFISPGDVHVRHSSEPPTTPTVPVDARLARAAIRRTVPSDKHRTYEVQTAVPLLTNVAVRPYRRPERAVLIVPATVDLDVTFRANQSRDNAASKLICDQLRDVDATSHEQRVGPAQRVRPTATEGDGSYGSPNADTVGLTAEGLRASIDDQVSASWAEYSQSGSRSRKRYRYSLCEADGGVPIVR